MTPMIEVNNKEIEQIKSILKSLSEKDSSKTVKKISGNESWNCSSLGNKSLIKGKINSIKILKAIG